MSTCQLPLICIAPKTPSNGEFHYTMLILFPIHLYSKSRRHLPSAEVWRKLKIAPYFAHSYGQTWHWTLTNTLHTALCVIMVVVGVESLICGTNLECLPKMLTSYFDEAERKARNDRSESWECSQKFRLIQLLLKNIKAALLTRRWRT